MNKQEIISEIKKSVTESARKARDDAGFSGSWGDGGAAQMEEKLKWWLDGIQFAESGETSVYASMVKRLEEEADPEFAEFKRLQEKFNK